MTRSLQNSLDDKFGRKKPNLFRLPASKLSNNKVNNGELT